MKESAQKEEMGENVEGYIERIVEMCREKNVEILLLSTHRFFQAVKLSLPAEQYVCLQNQEPRGLLFKSCFRRRVPAGGFDLCKFLKIFCLS